MAWRWARVRRWTLVATLLTSTGLLAWRIRDIRRAPRIRVSDRVASLMYLRLVSRSVYAYAEQFGRPPYNVDSIYGHLDSAQKAGLDADFAGLWQFGYWWTWCDYRLNARTAPPPDSMRVPLWLTRGVVRFTRDVSIQEGYTWPPGVGRTTDCTGGPMAIDASR